MRLLLNTFILISSFVFLFSCDDDDVTSTCCDETTIISDVLFRNATSDHFFIVNAVIQDDCLNVEFSASGCSGESWELQMVDAGAIAESLPPQRSLRMLLKNNELCEALITREVSFDIKKLRIDGNDELLINLEDWDDQILYQY